MKKSFEAWFAEVNKWVEAKIGLSVNDLSDCSFRDWYDDGVSAKSAAIRAIKNSE